MAELHGLIVKTSGLIAPVHHALQPLADRVHAAFVYGSVARGMDQVASDIDLIVIADDLDYGRYFPHYRALKGSSAVL